MTMEFDMIGQEIDCVHVPPHFFQPNPKSTIFINTDKMPLAIADQRPASLVILCFENAR